MGAYLSAPKTAKDSSDGGDDRFSWGVSDMQGWRRGMEDAHSANSDVPGSGRAACFAVYDGHGGKNVAIWCSRHVEGAVFDGTDADLRERLKKAFLKMDVAMCTEAARVEMLGYSSDEEGAAAGDEGGSGGGGGDTAEGDGGGASLAPGGAVTLSQAMASGELDLSQLPEPIQQALAQLQAEEAAAAAARSAEPAAAAGEAPVAAAGADGDGETSSSAAAAAEEPPSDWQPRSGCTAVVACIDGTRLIVANAGDSRCVLCRSGQAVAMSEDHKPDDERESARIYAAGGVVEGGRVNGNLNLSRAIGDLEFKQVARLPPEEQMITADPDFVEEQIDEGCEFLILACDGIFDCKTNEQVVAFARERLLEQGDGGKLSAICEELMDECLALDTQGVGTDNMTMMVVVLRPVSSWAVVEPAAKKAKV